MRILVTGAAGYIGSALTSELIKLKHDVIAIDNLSTGYYINKKSKFIKLDLLDLENLKKLFSENKIDIVMHLAAYSNVEESEKNKKKYKSNIIGTKNLINCMSNQKIIFSSSASVYGDPVEYPITEDSPLNPKSYYAQTKCECENLIINSKKPYVIFRYFNVVGNLDIKYKKDSNDLISNILASIKGKELLIYGSDYETKDGTAIRDFIHVVDIIKAHISAIDLEIDEIINLGTNNGISVMQMVNAFVDYIKKPIPYKFVEKREGDISISVASNTKAKILLNWEPEKKIIDVVKSLI